MSQHSKSQQSQHSRSQPVPSQHSSVGRKSEIPPPPIKPCKGDRAPRRGQTYNFAYPGAMNGPRMSNPLVVESQIIMNFNEREAGEGHAGAPFREGLENMQVRMEEMGRKPKSELLKNKVVTQGVNTRGMAGDAKQIYRIAKARAIQGNGNPIDHGTITGELGILG